MRLIERRNRVSVPLRGLGRWKANAEPSPLPLNLRVSVPLRGLGRWKDRWCWRGHKRGLKVSVPLRGLGRWKDLFQTKSPGVAKRFSPLTGIRSVESRTKQQWLLRNSTRFSPLTGIRSVERLRVQVQFQIRRRRFSPLTGIRSVESSPCLSTKSVSFLFQSPYGD